MPRYFKQFPKLDYEFYYIDKKGDLVESTKTMTNITYKYSLSRDARFNSSTYYAYQWRDDQRPDVFSDLYYNTDSLFWLVMYGADRFDVFNEFPKSDKIFYDFLYKKYKEDAKSAINAEATRLAQQAFDSAEAGKEQEAFDSVFARNSFIDSKNTVVEYCKTTPLNYIDGDGDIIDIYTYNRIPFPKSIQYIYDFELEHNESLRAVNVISDTFASKAKNEFEDKLSELNAEIGK